MKISRVKQKEQKLEKFYTAGRRRSNTTCIFNWLWLHLRTCLLSVSADSKDNGR